MFLAPEIKYVSTINEFRILQEHKTFKGFNDSKWLLDQSQNFIMLGGKKISATLPKSWKKSFYNGFMIPTKMRFCNEGNEKRLFIRCSNQYKESKEFEANLNLIKGQALNEVDLMFSCFEE